MSYSKTPGEAQSKARNVQAVSTLSQSNAVVLLSGGLDSTTAMAIAMPDGFAVHAISFRYGQRHAHELVCAERIAKELGAKQHVVVSSCPLRAKGLVEAGAKDPLLVKFGMV